MGQGRGGHQDKHLPTSIFGSDGTSRPELSLGLAVSLRMTTAASTGCKKHAPWQSLTLDLNSQMGLGGRIHLPMQGDTRNLGSVPGSRSSPEGGHGNLPSFLV